MYSFTKRSNNASSGVYSFTNRNKAQSYSAPMAVNTKSVYEEEDEEEEKNKGGFFGGLGYFFEKLGLGFMQGVEGIVDYTVGGVSELLGAMGVDGAEDFAEDVIGTDWMNYNHADEWFNPSEGWKVAGDVAGGIGTSLPGILTTSVLAAATGGASLAVQAAGLGVAGLSAAGTSTKEAYQETGKLGGAEFGYGALQGAVEVVTERLTGKVLGTGLTKVANATTAALGKGATAFAKTVGKNAAFGMAKEFTSEAFEEGFAEWISPYIKRLTYDPNAEKATAEEIAYAALVGGLAGVATGAGVSAVVRGKNTFSGVLASKKGETATILDKAQLYMGEDAATSTDFKETVEKIYKKYQDTTGDGALAKVKRARLLGELKSAEVNGAMSGLVKRSAISATQNAEAIAQRLNSDGRYKMVDGKLTFVADSKTAPTGDNVRDITAEDIRRGYDPSKKNSLDKALKDNEVLRYVAASDAAGRFMLQATEVENATLRGEQIRNETEYKRLREEASPEARAAMSRELGIDLNTASFEEFNAAVKAYKESGRADAYQAKIKKIEEIKSKKDSKAYAIPRAISLADGGIRHYTDGQSNIAIARDGESFIIYDYDSGKVSRSLSRAEVNSALAKYREGTMNEAAVTSESAAEVKPQNANTSENLSSASENVREKAESASDIWEKGVTEADRKAATEARKQAAELDSYAKENIKDYDNLSRANKLTVRDVIRKARESGISEADALSYARVAARTGLDIQFNQKECYKGKNEAGEDVYHAGFYDPENNRIVVNPKTEKKHTVLLIHELSHAMRSYLKNGEVKYFIDEAALKIDKKTGKLEKGEVKLSPEMWAAVKKYYTDKNGKLDTELAFDEASAYYAEALFGTEGAIDLLLGEKPTLKQKILSFFTKSAAYYSTDEKLSKEARRHFKKFKAMFDSFALRNTVNNTDVAAVGGKTGRRYSFSSIAFSFHGVDNMTVAEFEAKDYKKTEGYKAYVDECLENMRQTQKDFDDKKAKKYIEDSIDGIVSVAVAMKKAGYDIADTAEQRSAKDTKDRLLFSSLEPNSDYFTSSDISTICDKRQNFAEIYDDIVRAEEAKGVPKGKRFFDNVDNYFYIHKVLADKGLTQPCRQCYVESMRKNLAPMANAFLTLVQESDGNNTKNAQLYNQSGKDKGKIKSNNATTREEVRKILDGYGFSPEKLTVKMLTTADGLAEIKLTMPELYERFNSFYGQSKPKMPKGATPFRFGELTALLTDNKGRIKEGLVKKINSTGGFRLQSYSDFQTKNYADVLQVLFEASTLGLNGHAYTKVPAFLDATADTNLKRNISIFMYNDGGKWKIDRNDSFPYTLEQIYDVVRADKSGNTGIIAVVQNEDMAAYVMANDNIGYFIPFHKSGIKMGVVRETTVKEGGREIKGYKNIKDHTRQQTEVWAKTTEDHKANTKVSNPINIYEEGLWDFENADGLSRNELIEKNVKAYIDECEKRGYLPKFREYVMNNEKVLNSVLSYAKELGTVAETATVDDISFEYKGYRIPYGYYKCLGDFSMITPNGKASGIEPLSLENYKFDKAVKYFSDAESVRRNEILQQFTNGNEREYYRDSTMSAEELQKVLDTKRTEVVNEIVGKSARRYSMAGTNAATADHSRLITAKEMIADGKDSETIRKETGWFVSYDGKWRYEIDDSQAVWHFDTAKPDSERLFYFGERKFKLTDLLDHPALYEAYPQLKKVTVWENPNAKTSGYVVGRNTDNITVQSLANMEIKKDILLHEIQHIIQNIEGFATGASVDQFDYKAWGEKEFAAYEKRNEVANKLYAILRRHGVSITKADIEAVRTAFEVSDSIIDYNFMLMGSLADSNPRTKALYDEYVKQMQILNLTTPSGQYHAVAGEIEAHDVQARRRMTAEQRKNTRPNIDREDTILIGGSFVSQNLLGWTADNIEVYETDPAIMKMSNFDRIKKFKRDFLQQFKGRTAKFTRNGHTYYARFVENQSGLGKFAFEGNNPKSKSDDSGYRAKIRLIANGDIFDIVENSDYKKSEPESGKQTFAHKNAKYWDYFWKEIFVDGKGYDVVINVRNDSKTANLKDKTQFVYSMSFVENKKVATPVITPASSEAVDVNLGLSTDVIIPQNPKKVNTSDKNSSKNSRRASAELDNSYLSAVNRGDMVTAQRMVDEAAYNKNYVVAAFHGTPNGGFTKFGGHKTRNGAKAAGSYWFSEEVEHARVYKSYPQNYPAAENPMIYNVFLDIGEWADIGNGRVEALDYSIDGSGAATKDLKNVAKSIAYKTQYKHWDKSEAARARKITQRLVEIGREISADFVWQITETQEFADLCISEGLNTVIAWEEHKEYDENGERKTHMVKTYGVFSPEQIKSADPVTYDDDGNVIPLSERFNSKKSDIRFSMEADYMSATNNIDVDFEKIDKWFESLSLKDLKEFVRENSKHDSASDVEWINDISDEVDVSPKKVEIYFRRNGLGNSYVEDGRKAVMTQKRIDEAIEDYGATAPDYAIKYITRIPPEDFIDLTVRRDQLDRNVFDAEVRGDHDSTMTDWDYVKALHENRNPWLVVRKSTGEIVGHNGRHRLRALEMAGIESVEIEVEFVDDDGSIIKRGAETIPDMVISSQFDTATSTHISNIIPFNESHRAEIEATYGEKKSPKAAVRYSMESDIEASRASIVMDMDKRYKPSKSEAVSDFFTNFQIQTTNAQAGIEKVLKKNGVKDAEALVQVARVGADMADAMFGREQFRIGAEKNEDKVKVGRGLSEIMKPIENATAIAEELKGLSGKEADAKREQYVSDFFTYLFHEHNVDRMSLRSRQIEWMREDLVKLESEVNELKAKKKELAEALGKENTKEGKKRIRKEIAENRKALDKATNEYAKTKVNIEAAERFIELEATKNEISEEIKGLKKELEAEGITKDEKKAIADDLKSARNKLGDVKREMTNLKVIMSDNSFELAVDKPVIGRAVDENGNTVVSTVDDEDTDGTDEGASKPKVQPYTSEESRAIADELLKKHPEFAKSAEELWGFSRNLNQYRVDTGLITQEQFDYMQKLYPHYVPTYREGSAQGIAALKGKYDVAVKSTVKSATGSVRPLLRPDVIIARQTMETVRAGAINKLARALHDAAGNTEDVTVIEKKKVSSEEAAEIDITEVKPKNNRVIFFRDGEKIELQVTKEIFAGFDDFNSKSKDGALIGTAAWITDKYKKLVTSYSPLFIVRNMVRDLQDAGINTKYAKKFAKNYIRAIKQIATNGEYWQLYRAMGGLGTSLFDFDKGYSTTTNKKGLPTKRGMVRKFFQSIENANVFVEQLPRLAEFMSAMQSGKSAEQALLDAADVTTNFGRGGKLVKAFNRTFVPFLNPAVQGFSKIVRMITSIRSMREFSSLLFKCAILGIVPIILNQLMYGDDEDYEKLRESDKENNFLIKLPNNTFIKIPRGRVTSVLAGLYNRPAAAIKGEDVDWGDYLDNVSTQISPVDGGIPRDIFSPIRDIYSNKTWYGTDIENQSDELVAPGERYDESTSEIAKAIGGILNVSPKKIHYLIDQYSGVVGDIVLPATSNKANRGYFLGNTTIDPTTQNKLSSSFYDAIDGVTYIKNSKSGKYTEEEMLEARAVSKYYNDVKQKISDLNEKKREINNNSKLSNSEKRKQIDVIQTMINEYYKEALTDASAVANVYSTTDTLGTGDIYSNYVTSIKGEENFAETYENLRYIETIKQLYGSETALSEYNKSVYEKSQLYNALGISYDKYYDYYFTTKGIESDVDKQGNTIAGSKKTKVLKAIKKLGGSKNQQILMLYAAGYTVQDGDIKGVSAERAKTILLNAIMKLNVTKAEKAEIAKSFGFTVKNGKIIKDF